MIRRPPDFARINFRKRYSEADAPDYAKALLGSIEALEAAR